MATAKREAVYAFRKDPLRLVLSVEGYDLTNAAPAFAVRQVPDVDPTVLACPATTSAGTQGCRVVSVTTEDDGVPTTLIEVFAPKSAMAGLPAPGVAGDDVELFYDLQWTPPDEGLGLTAAEETILYGKFIVKGSING